MSDHAWVQENLDAYLAGGLPLEERDRLEQHVAGCDACVSALAAAQKLERVLTGLFVPVRPDAALEDRAIQHLRKARPRRLSRWSMTMRVLGSAAAVLVLGGVGVVVQALASDGGLPFPGLERKPGNAQVASRTYLGLLKQLGLSDGEVLDTDMSNPEDLPSAVQGRMQSTNNLSSIGIVGGKVRRSSNGEIKAQDGPMVTYTPDGTVVDQLSVERLADVSVPGEAKRSGAIGIMDGDKSRQPLNIPAPSGWGRGQAGAPDPNFSVPTFGYSYAEKGQEMSGLSRDAGKLGGEKFGRSGGGSKPGGGGGVEDKRELLRHEAEDLKESDKKQGKYYGDFAYRPSKLDDLATKTENRPVTGTPTPPPVSGPALPTAPAGSKGPLGSVKDKEFKDHFGRMQAGAPPGKSEASYFKPGQGHGVTMGTDLWYDSDQKQPKARTEAKAGDKAEERAKDEKALGLIVKSGATKLALPEPVVVEQPKATDPPVEAARKIIRTGEMEFEIDSFDNSVAGIATLISKVKGGFIATVNSDKLPNGKVRGSVVVRMPPEFLDKFLLDLRKELGKVGELKTQRIGSQDVTKQYTDIESRLRAARTMEEKRFINIIKTGKGEVKDLIAAERELGIWRTKIEEMEGEIRYYNNQVGLSTLTITLTEKEIQAPSALVITERVGMRIEVEDVEKAHIDALKAVAEEKGRITKSELKQHPAGQLEANLQVEVAPDKAKKLRDLFKKLGNVTFNDVQRVQQAVGGSGGVLDTKLRQNDVQISLVLYDTANIQPRESVTQLIATDDVQASYRELQAAVLKAKGQTRVGQLREPDKVNISAEFSFDVPSPEKQGIDKILAKLGVLLSSTDNQVPINEVATDRKFGYRLTLRSMATVPARETSIQRIAVSDVPTVFRELQEAVLAAKGVLHVQQLNETTKVNIDAVLSFDIPKADRPAFDKVLAKLGLVLSSTSAKAPANEITTDRKFGYRLDLLNLASIKPRETINLQIATNDVPAGFRELQDAVVQAKGVIHVGQVKEQDRLNISAEFNFDLAKEDRAIIDKLVVKIGNVLTSSTSQVPLNEVATDRKIGYRLTLLNLANIRPREIFVLQLAANDVPTAFQELRDAVVQAKGVIHLDQLVEDNKVNVVARLDFDVSTADKPAIDKLVAKSGALLKRSNSQANVNELASDRKVGYRLVINNVANIPPREVVTVRIEVDDVDRKVSDLSALVRASKGQVGKPRTTTTPQGEVSAMLKFDVPLSAADSLVPQIKALGVKPVVDQTPNPLVPENELATAQFVVTLVGGRPTIPSDEGLWAPIQNSLYISFRALTWSIMFVILGLCVVLPWVLVLWAIVKVFRRLRGKPAEAAA